MTDRACALGCTQRGVHYSTCPDYAGDGACPGCAPRTAYDGSLICGRCYNRLRSTADSIPDCILAMETAADPQKAREYRQRLSGTKDETPAPVRAQVLDAYTQVMDTLTEGVTGLTGSRHRIPRLTDGAETVGAEAFWLASSIIEWLPRITNDADALTWWVDVLVGTIDDDHLPEDQRGWTLQRALSTFRVAPYVRPSGTPCPDCDTKTILIRQPRVAPGATTYTCTTTGCDFERTDQDTDQPWTFIFEGVTLTAEGTAA